MLCQLKVGRNKRISQLSFQQFNYRNTVLALKVTIYWTSMSECLRYFSEKKTGAYMMMEYVRRW